MPRPRAELLNETENPESDLLSDPNFVKESEYNFEKDEYYFDDRTNNIEENIQTWNHYLNYQDINHDGGGVTSNPLFQLCRNSLFGYNQKGNLGPQQDMHTPANAYFNPIVLPKRITEYNPKTHKIKAFQYKDPSKSESTPGGKSLSRPDVINESSSIRDTEKANKLGLKEDITPSYYFDPASRTYYYEYFERLQKVFQFNEEEQKREKGEGFTVNLTKYGFKKGTDPRESNDNESYVHIQIDPRSKDGTVITMEIRYFYCDGDGKQKQSMPNLKQSMPNFNKADIFQVSIASNSFVCTFDNNNNPVFLDDKDPSNYLQGNPTKNKFFKDNEDNITDKDIITHGRRLIICKLLGDLLHAVFATTNQIVFTNDSYLRDRCIYNGISVVANELTNMRVIESKHSSPFRLFFTDELFTKNGKNYITLGGVKGKRGKPKVEKSESKNPKTNHELKTKDEYEKYNVVGVFASNEVQINKNEDSLFHGDTNNKIMGIKTYSYYSLCNNPNNFIHLNDQEFIRSSCEEMDKDDNEEKVEYASKDDSQEMVGGDLTNKPILIEFADKKFDEYMTLKEYSFVSLFKYIQTFTEKDSPKLSREKIKDLKYDFEIHDCIEQHGLNDGNLEEKINLFYELVELAIKNNKLDELDIELFYLKNIHAKKGSNNEQLLNAFNKLNEITSEDGIYLTDYDLLEYLYDKVNKLKLESAKNSSNEKIVNSNESSINNFEKLKSKINKTEGQYNATEEDINMYKELNEQQKKSIDDLIYNHNLEVNKPVNVFNNFNYRPEEKVYGGKPKKTSRKKKKPSKKQTKSKKNKTKRIQIKKRKQTKKKIRK